MFQLVYCVGGSLKNLCHFEREGLANADVIRGGKIRKNLADVICERSLNTSSERGFMLYCRRIVLL